MIKVGWEKTLITLIVILAYYKLCFLYFQQDEWHNYGYYIYDINKIGYLQTFFKAVSVSFPIVQIINFINYSVFGIQTYFLLFMVFILVVLNIVFWTKNIYIITKSKMVTYGSILFGYLTFVPAQALTWVMPSIGYQAAFLSLNISLYVLIKISKQFTKKYLFYLLVSVFAIYFTRSNAYFWILLSPFLYLYLKEGHFSKKSIYSFGILSFLAMLLLYVYLPYSQGRFINSFDMLIINAFYLPIKSISQILSTDLSLIYDVSEYISTNRFNLPLNDAYQQTVVAENISMVFSLTLIVFAVILFKYLEEKKRSLLLFFFFIYMFSYSGNLIDRFSTNVGCIESRYYFIPSFFLGLIVFTYIELLTEKINLIKHHYIKVFTFSITYTFVVLFFVINVINISNKIEELNITTNHKKEILQFAKDKFNHNGKFIIFIDDINTPYRNRTGQYFQTGFLYPFLVYSYDNKKISADFFQDDELWQMNFQGVRKEGNYLAGLFYEKGKLKNFIEQSDFPINNVYSLTFDYKNITGNSKPKSSRFIKYYDSSERLRNELIRNKKDIDNIVISPISTHTSAIPQSPYKSLYFVESQKNTETIDFNDDQITIYKDGLEFSYAGPYLKKTISSNGSKKYMFRKSMNGVGVSYIKGVYINGETQRFDVLDHENGLELLLDKSITQGSKLYVVFGLSGRTVVYNTHDSHKYILNELSVKLRGNGGTKYSVTTNDQVVALRMSWLNDKDRYQPYGQTPNGMVKIKRWLLSENKLDVELEKSISANTEITVLFVVKEDFTDEFLIKLD